ncbi:tRNA dihydrouridine synthase DusB [Dasania marina]|uniref:tRNA dihydrouridine synthase DusB n=1 Tax=Dasania marina TaxID=471499 RepID=UPI00036C5A71|nr:tRNA dihydrouridine synthase DusB [Dasania marina]|tara:strand:+ start:10671 stop:11672 length:1002 start_codon:yes stop_codon:yes gene_type:complete
MLQIGHYQLDSRVVLAPMAGVTDRPFRQMCKQYGVGLAVSEMVTSDSSLWHSRKSQHRLNHEGEQGLRSIQIAGGDAAMMAQAAKLNAAMGAQIIDINMGCPAKKVCKKAAGSALMKDEALVSEILQAVVAAVDIPVTLKIRTGWSPEQRNGVSIARIAEDHGIAALAVHGRTRACAFNGEAEYDTIAAIKAAVNIPIIANGDIDTPAKAKQVIAHTGADAVMVGRAAQGRPWICHQIDQYLCNDVIVAAPNQQQVRLTLLQHMDALYAFYGEFMGVKIARKHVGWYLKEHTNNGSFKKLFNQLDSAHDQRLAITDLLSSDLIVSLNTKEKAA